MEINFSKQTCYSNKSYKKINLLMMGSLSVLKLSVGGVSCKVNQGSFGFSWFLPLFFLRNLEKKRGRKWRIFILI